MKLTVSVPEKYKAGAYLVNAELSPDEKAAYDAWPISFQIPRLPKRLVHTKPHYLVAASTENDIQLNGIFIEGVWESDIYSNGVAEEENPTPISKVEQELKRSIESAIDASQSMYRTVKELGR